MKSLVLGAGLLFLSLSTTHAAVTRLTIAGTVDQNETSCIIYQIDKYSDPVFIRTCGNGSAQLVQENSAYDLEPVIKMVHYCAGREAKTLDSCDVALADTAKSHSFVEGGVSGNSYYYKIGENWSIRISTSKDIQFYDKTPMQNVVINGELPKRTASAPAPQPIEHNSARVSSECLDSDDHLHPCSQSQKNIDDANRFAKEQAIVQHLRDINAPTDNCAVPPYGSSYAGYASAVVNFAPFGNADEPLKKICNAMHK